MFWEVAIEALNQQSKLEKGSNLYLHVNFGNIHTKGAGVALTRNACLWAQRSNRYGATKQIRRLIVCSLTDTWIINVGLPVCPT